MSSLQLLESKVTSLEGLVTTQEWDAVIPAIQEFCALEEELTQQLVIPPELGAVRSRAMRPWPAAVLA